MEPEKISKRLDALDGLRGVAILLVALSHIDLRLLEQKGYNIFQQVLFDSGELGVGFLFILSGFLMVFLYSNPKSRLDFLQKRYTRIFPAFVTVCVFFSLATLSENFSKDIWLFVKVLLALSSGAYLLWFLIKKLSFRIRRGIFLSFIGLQILTGFLYLFWVMRMPISQYMDQIPFGGKLVITALVNSTLTLPLGSYIGPLSSVFWSLAAEVYFYIFYAVVAIPLLRFLTPQKRIIKLLLLFASLPFFVGFYLVTSKILYLDFLHLELAYFFFGGMVLGYLYKKNKIDFSRINLINNPVVWILSIFSIAGVLALSHFALNNSKLEWRPIVKIFLAIPFGVVMLLVLNNRSWISKIFSFRLLTFIGTVSYSLYLIHLPVLELVKVPFGLILDPVSGAAYILLALLVCLLISTILFILLERPYFEGKKDEEKSNIVWPKWSLYFFQSRVLMIGSWVLLLFMVVVSSNAGLKFLSLENTNFKETIISPIISEKDAILLNEFKKVEMKVQAEHNNLSIVELNLGLGDDPSRRFEKQELTFRVRERGTNDWQESRFNINNKEDPLRNLYGFSPIPNSQGKIFEMELELDNPNSSNQIFLKQEPYVSKSIYLLEKSDLSNPLIFWNFLGSKLSRVIGSWESQMILLLFAPIFGLSAYLVFKEKRLNSYN